MGQKAPYGAKRPLGGFLPLPWGNRPPIELSMLMPKDYRNCYLYDALWCTTN